MKKKILFIPIIVLVCIVALILLVSNFNQIKYYYLFHINDNSQGTGAITTTPNPILIEKSNRINKLRENLPYSTKYFIINRFNYKTAKFEIVFNDLKATDKEEIFSEWLKSSEFSPIPLSVFEIE